MKKIKEGDIVGRKSYGKDIIFFVKDILEVKGEKQAILKGITVRIEASAPLNDLEIINKQLVEKNLRSLERKLEDRIRKCSKENNVKNSFFKRQYFRKTEAKIKTGLILHLDGDKKYSEKSAKYYRSVGLNAIVKNIPESKQAYMVENLLKKYNPDILVITGHDRYDKRWNEI